MVMLTDEQIEKNIDRSIKVEAAWELLNKALGPERLLDEVFDLTADELDPEDLLERALSAYLGAKPKAIRREVAEQIARFVEDQDDDRRTAEDGEWNCYSLAEAIRKRYDVDREPLAIRSGGPWKPIYIPPSTSGYYLVATRNSPFSPQWACPFDAERAAEMRCDPQLAAEKSALFGWGLTAVHGDPTHWRQLPEPPPEKT